MPSIKRKPAENRTYPSRPSKPIFVTWRRYIPVRPARARAAMSNFSKLRAITSVVVMEVTSMWG